MADTSSAPAAGGQELVAPVEAAVAKPSPVAGPADPSPKGKRAGKRDRPSTTATLHVADHIQSVNTMGPEALHIDSDLTHGQVCSCPLPLAQVVGLGLRSCYGCELKGLQWCTQHYVPVGIVRSLSGGHTHLLNLQCLISTPSFPPPADEDGLRESRAGARQAVPPE